jgi:hypothetical protein
MRKANKAVLLLLVALLCGAVVPVQTTGQTTSHQDGNDLLPRCQQAVEAIGGGTRTPPLRTSPNPTPRVKEPTECDLRRREAQAHFICSVQWPFLASP